MLAIYKAMKFEILNLEARIIAYTWALQ